LIGYQAHVFTVSADEYNKCGNYFLVCVGNGTWEGGGFKVTPAAIPDDGKFQVCCVTGKSVWGVLPILPFTLNGTHVQKKIVETFNTTSVIVESPTPFPIHGDGEIFGTNILQAEIHLVPKALKVAIAHTQ
jgi:diacylglycerol kinase (ATP)